MQPPDISQSAASFIPSTHSLKVLAIAAQECRGCELYRHATQVVFGSGKRTSRFFLVGEQPGDQEDLQGEPFVGPAGQLLNRVLDEAGIAKSDVYLTNSVKHFKFELRGKKRLHQKPSSREVRACRPWLEKELQILHPEVLICLGATAAKSLLGSKIRIIAQHGQHLNSEWCANTMVTFHPSAVLRAPDAAARRKMGEALLADLKQAAQWLQSPS